MLFLIGGCQNEFPAEQVPLVTNDATAAEATRPMPAGPYTIAPGDSVLVNSYYHPELKQPATVQPDGRISLVLVGEVTASGKTPRALASELTRAYRKYLNDAEITVTLSESAGQAVYIGGEVAKPSMLPLKGELTLLEGITAAGGFLHTANKGQVLIVRKLADGGHRTLQANAESILHNEAGDIKLSRHDVVIVPKSDIAKVDQFVEQYINNVIPRSVNTVFGWQYQLGGLPSSNSQTIIQTPVIR